MVLLMSLKKLRVTFELIPRGKWPMHYKLPSELLYSENIKSGVISKVYCFSLVG